MKIWFLGPENLKLVGGKSDKRQLTELKFNMAAPVPGFTIPAPDHCRKGRQCSKFNGHKGRYNSERSWNTFWRNSPVYNLNVRKRSLALEEERVGAVAEELAAKAARLDVRESELREGKLDMQKKLDDTGNQAIMIGDDPLRKTETRLCEKRSQTGHCMQSEEETNDASTREPGSKSKSAGNQAIMVGDDPPRKTETRLCEEKRQTGHCMQSEEETNDASTREPGSKSKSAGNQAIMVGDDPLGKMETRLCEKRSQTGHCMQSEEETKKEPGSKSKVEDSQRLIV
ncbi:hypothetical protein AWC38_SpisGene18777 [Stylophora pistillata]|uniref:Uncharacterized protein n=1 Tax=Stylophora pistillata TaxID=50429 RepID=A0A2B4RIB2_STYPI|nr:hypothetical protein AWC38_SpisGene18777 [Stylophora pistillata]